jgi:uncharacterized membrane protein YphA (DoxX/SURF4 family)
MLRILLAFVLLVHGLIHLLGFVRAWNLAPVPQLTGKTLFPIAEAMIKPVGLLWLLTCLLFVAAAALVLLKHNTWWMPAALGVVLSQALIVVHWTDARFGTVANVIILLAALVAAADWQLDRRIERELQTLLPAGLPAEAAVIEPRMWAHLPPLVQRWLERSNVAGKPAVHTVHLRQTGAMRSAPGGRWMPFDAEQFFTVDEPGFVWIADVHVAPGLYLSGVDRYRDGHGSMQIKALSLVPVVDSRGAAIDQGTLLRYLGEISWFPGAALHPYITWQQLDDARVRATMSYGGTTAAMVFTFSADGDLLASDADRYYDRKTGPTLEQWHIEARAFGERAGVRMPVAYEVTWKLAEGDFTWLNLEIGTLEYNVDASAVRR